MKYPLYNHSNLDLAPVKHLFDSFLPFATKYLSISKCPEVHLVSDKKNAQLPLGKTAFYNPDEQKITIFTDNRHIKDILRSLSHELVHHMQNLQGMFDGSGFTGPGYAQKNQHLRDLEREAYEKGNLCLRDWEDKHKKQLQESIYTIKGDNSKMSYKNWRNQEVNDRLMESWGYKAPKTEILSENKEISHLCAMLVTEKSTGRVGHPINHTLLENGDVTHYDVEFDDVIIEGVPVAALNVEVQQEHMHSEDREDYKHGDKPRKKYMEEEKGTTCEEVHPGMDHKQYLEENELDEAHCGHREDEEGEIEEAKQFANDDTLDGDKDGKPKWADPDDPANKNEAMVRKTIREAITKALKRRSEG